MSKIARWQSLCAALVLGASLTACAGTTAGTPPLGSAPAAESLAKTAPPPMCNQQSTTSLYAMSATLKLKAKATWLCIPSFAGFGGKIEYPPARPTVAVQTITSTTDYNDSMTYLVPEKKPMLFLQLVVAGPTTFGAKVEAKGGLTGAKLVAGKTYSVLGGIQMGGVAHVFSPFTPCLAVATAGKYGGVIQPLGSRLERQKLPSAVTIIYEIYPGKHASAKC